MGAVCCSSPRFPPSTLAIMKQFSEIDMRAHSLETILDDDFETEIADAVVECMASFRTAYQDERGRLLSELRRAVPESCGGGDVFLSDRLDSDEIQVNEMAYKAVASAEMKQRLHDQVNKHIRSSFELQTTDWSPKSLEAARSFLDAFIQNLLEEAMDQVIGE